MVVIVACQGVVELRGTRRREWSSAVTVIAACQGVMELHRVRRREWSSVVRDCGLPGGPDLSVEVRLESVARFDIRRSLDEVFSRNRRRSLVSVGVQTKSTRSKS